MNEWQVSMLIGLAVFFIFLFIEAWRRGADEADVIMDELMKEAEREGFSRPPRAVHEEGEEAPAPGPQDPDPRGREARGVPPGRGMASVWRARYYELRDWAWENCVC